MPNLSQLPVARPVTSSAAQRQRAWRERRAAEGLITVTVTVPMDQAAELRIAAHALCADRTLSLLMLVSKVHGRFVSSRKWRP